MVLSYFFIVISDIVDFINYSLIMYADDTSAVITGTYPIDVQNRSNILLSELRQCFSGNNLYLILKKKPVICSFMRQDTNSILMLTYPVMFLYHHRMI